MLYSVLITVNLHWFGKEAFDWLDPIIEPKILNSSVLGSLEDKAKDNRGYQT